jgi:hypothetical protein
MANSAIREQKDNLQLMLRYDNGKISDRKMGENSPLCINEDRTIQSAFEELRQFYMENQSAKVGSIWRDKIGYMTVVTKYLNTRRLFPLLRLTNIYIVANMRHDLILITLPFCSGDVAFFEMTAFRMTSVNSNSAIYLPWKYQW